MKKRKDTYPYRLFCLLWQSIVYWPSATGLLAKKSRYAALFVACLVTVSCNNYYDDIAPKLTKVTIKSSDADNSAEAYIGVEDKIIIEFSATRELDTPEVTIIIDDEKEEKDVTVSNVSQGVRWKAELTVTKDHEEDSEVSFLIKYRSKDGVKGENVSRTTDGSRVAVVKPKLSSVTISSNNTNPKYAKGGDTITVNFKARFDIKNSPVVRIANLDATEANTGDGDKKLWKATVNLPTDDIGNSGVQAGRVLFEITFKSDKNGNDGTTATSTTDGSSVENDFDPPKLVRFESDPEHSSDSAHSFFIVADEGLRAVEVQIGGQASNRLEVRESNSLLKRQLVYTIPASNQDETIDITLTDNAGNETQESKSIRDIVAEIRAQTNTQPQLKPVGAQHWLVEKNVNPSGSFQLTNTGGSNLLDNGGCTVQPSLPKGLLLARTSDNSTCTIVGVPKQTQSANKYTIKATNAKGSSATTFRATVHAMMCKQGGYLPAAISARVFAWLPTKSNEIACRYVTQQGSNLQNGLSWENAYPLEHLFDLDAHGSGPYLYMVQSGVYARQDRSFSLSDNVVISGGWSGNGFESDGKSVFTVAKGDSSASIFAIKDVQQSVVHRVVLADGHSANGGAVYMRNSNVAFVDVAFVNNRAKKAGGAVYSVGKKSGPTFFGSTFSRNSTDSATGIGGAVMLQSGYMQAYNTTFAHNSSADGSAMALANADGLTQVTLVNVLIWDDENNSRIHILNGAEKQEVQLHFGPVLLASGMQSVRNAHLAHVAYNANRLVTADPYLAEAQDNGGQIMTHAIFASSAAINAGSYIRKTADSIEYSVDNSTWTTVQHHVQKKTDEEQETVRFYRDASGYRIIDRPDIGAYEFRADN